MPAVLARLEAARIDIEKTIDQSGSRIHWRTLVRGVLIHWLGELFQEGQGRAEELKTELAIAQRQVEALQVVNADLQDEVRILRKQI
jgi:hypothetical protein